MNFIQKLTQDTSSGMWDFIWKYSDGAKSFTFNKQKHYLSGLSFSMEKDNDLLVFPNGFGLNVGSEAIILLMASVIDSLERTVRDSVETYLSGEVVTQDGSTEGEDGEDSKNDSVAPTEDEKPEKPLTKQVVNDKIK